MQNFVISHSVSPRYLKHPPIELNFCCVDFLDHIFVNCPSFAAVHQRWPNVRLDETFSKIYRYRPGGYEMFDFIEGVLSYGNTSFDFVNTPSVSGYILPSFCTSPPAREPGRWRWYLFRFAHLPLIWPSLWFLGRSVSTRVQRVHVPDRGPRLKVFLPSLPLRVKGGIYQR